MALKIAHLLAYECEDGLLMAIHHTHNERDAELADAQRKWESIGGEGKAPCFALDILADENATIADIKKDIMRHQAMAKLKSSLFKLLATMLLADLVEGILPPGAKEPKNPDSDQPHPVH